MKYGLYTDHLRINHLLSGHIEGRVNVLIHNPWAVELGPPGSSR